MPPSVDPYPWPTAELVIPTRTPRPTILLSVSELESRVVFSSQQQRESVAPTRDPVWEEDFYAAHNRQPDAQDVADRHWSLGFLVRTGRGPTDAEWERNYYER